MPATLQLTLIAFRGLVPAVSYVREYDQDEILIGRAPDNDFVVDDPERYCSRYHARCYRADNQFFVEDTSTPGTQVNAGQFLTRGHRHRLVSGDLLHIGECQIQIELIENAMPVQQQVTNDAFSIDDFFADAAAVANGEPAPISVPLPNIPHTSSADFYQSTRSSVEQDFDFAEYANLDLPEAFTEESHKIDASSSDGFENQVNVPEALNESSADFNQEIPVYAEQEIELDRVGDLSDLQAIPPVSDMGVSEQEVSVPQLDLAEKTADEELKESSQQISDVDSKAIKAFLQGLNVEPSDLVGRNKEEIMFSAGQMLGVLTQGTMEILQSRNDVKKEFGMDVTRIGAQMNNPLKFSQTSGEAMVKLLTQAEGYMSAHDAVREGVVDAKAHQVAVMAGMQAAIVSMLERFKPEALEEKLTSKFVFSKKGKYWETYKDSYQQLVVEAEDNFHALFGDEFCQVYQEQAREIEASYSKE